VPIPYMRDSQVKSRVTVGENEFLVVAKGNEAKVLNSLGRGSPLTVEGHLVDHRWKTEDGAEHNRVEVHADKVIRGEA